MICKRGTEPPPSAEYYRDQLMCRGSHIYAIPSLILIPILCQAIQILIYYPGLL